MTQDNYWYLVLRYSSIRSYINKCYLSNNDDLLFDFIFALETHTGLGDNNA